MLQKPDASDAALKNITNYILENHPHDSGIIYCFSINVSTVLPRPLRVCLPNILQDTEDIAAGVSKGSNGKIKTGVYHAKIDDAQRMRLHKKWREGEVQVVCATIGKLPALCA